VVALPDVIEAGLLERSDAADVVANVVAEALRRDPERGADRFLLQLGAGIVGFLYDRCSTRIKLGADNRGQVYFVAVVGSLRSA
jgi:hypothetical protein